MRRRPRPACSEAIVTGTASIDGDALRAGRHGLRLHGRQHGQRRRREALAGAELASGEDLPAGRRVHLRRRAHAGGHPAASCRWPRRAAPSTSSTSATSPFVTVLADPCTGGVVASFATLADICVAEPGARLYFSGPRVIQQTTREELPDGLQHRRAQPRARPPRRRRARARTSASRSATTCDCWGEVRNLTDGRRGSHEDGTGRTGRLAQAAAAASSDACHLCPASTCPRRSRTTPGPPEEAPAREPSP